MPEGWVKVPEPPPGIAVGVRVEEVVRWDAGLVLKRLSDPLFPLDGLAVLPILDCPSAATCELSYSIAPVFDAGIHCHGVPPFPSV